MLYLLDKDVKTVKWNGIPLHEASSAIVKEETNGDFYITVRYPITDSSIYQLIKEDMLIKAPTPVLGPQLFRIKKPVENDDSLDITAFHITDDVMKRSINPVSVVGQSCAMALSQMVQNAKTDLGNFSFTSDIMDSRTFNTTETGTLYSVLLDGKHSIVGTWEGELVRDNFALTIKRSRGADRGVVITTHKNLKSYQRTKNSQSMVTRIHAKSTFKAEGAEEETTITVTVDSPLISNYPYINEKDYENNNAKTVDELRKWAEAKFKNEGIDKISDAIEIEAYELDGQVIHLGDTVNIKSRKHDVDLYKKAIAYEYNALTEKYISITFDDKPGVGGSGVSSGVSNAADVILGVNANAQEIAVERAIRNANQAFDAEFEKRVEEINDGIEQAQAEAERYADAIKQEIDTEIAQVNQSMQAQSEEHDRQLADILSKTQSVESLANQAKSDAASALARANQVKTEAIADARAQVATVSQALNTAKTELQTAIASADQKARDSQASATALRNDLNLQASKILEQARAQTALTSRVTSVETLADGTRSTVAELSKTVNKATGDIATVSSRTKTVEDTLSQTRSQYEALTQTVNTQTGQIESINRKTAELQSGIDGVTERFENLRVGGTNLFKNSDFSQGEKNWHKLPEIHNEATGKYVRLPARLWTMAQFVEVEQGEDYVISLYAKKISESSSSPRLNIKFDSLHNEDTDYVEITKTDWKRFVFKFRAKKSGKELVYFLNRNGIEVDIKNIKMEKGLLATDYSPSYEDLRSEIATYKRTAEESSAELSRQIQLADGKAVEAKTYAQQTADAINTRLESLETYKDAEGTRASQYLSASRTETAKQLTAERMAIATNYVAKSIYDENVRGTTLKLNEIKTTADTAKQNLATYQNTVDRKLEELTSSTQTLDGKINTASAKVDTVAGQIRTEISEVEGKIPITAGTRNLLRGTKELTDIYWTSNVTSDYYQGFKIARTTPSAATYIDTYRASTTIVPDATEYIISFYAKSSINGTPINNHFYSPNTTTRSESNTGYIGRGTDGLAIINLTTTWQRYWIKWTQTPSNTKKNVIIGRNFSANNATVEIAGVALYEGSLNKDWSPAPEDFANELSSVKTTITQTASGVEQLSTSLATTDNKVTTAEAKIRQLISDVSSKVSQTDYNTLTGRVDDAETAITQNATEISKRLTKTQVDKAITDKGFQTASQVDTAIAGKGYQTKSDVDNNITGRGYITSSALQPYALSTAVQNLVKETADSFSRTISETRALIPTEVGGRNLLLNSSDFVGWSKHDSGATITVSGYNNSKAVVTADASNSGYFANNTKYLPLELNTNYVASCWVFVRKRPTSCYIGFNNVRISNLNDVPLNKWVRVSKVFNSGASTSAYSSNGVFYLIASGGDVLFSAPKLETGTIPTDWSPAPEDLATVTALHDVKDTVSSHTRTIGAVGETGSILDNVSKVTQTAAGLVQEVSGDNGLKTQVSQLAGSYAIKNLTSSGKVLNQLNLNKDGSVKIDGSLVQITGRTYIQDGVITSAKIAGLDAGKITTGTLNAARIKANSIDGSKIVFDQAFLNKMTANEAYLRQLFAKDAFLTAVQAVSISASQITGGLMRATNGAMEIDFNNSAIDMFKDGAIRFHSGSNAIYRQSTDGIHTAFVHFDTTSKGGIYASLGSTSSRDGINSKSSGRFAGIRVARTSERSDSHVASQDAVELYGDTIFFGHGFEGGGFSMHTTLTGGRTISLNKMHDALINLCRCWIHLRNEGFNLNSSAFRKSLDTEIHNAQQLYNTIERIT
ncbi:phage tail spike protein [Streptococcus suis]|uniref:phage tail spike protein n=1 Tax=Streptococcus suis TaxID=1307 RepID=UPI001EE7C0D5|nr:phage tail spike protein [Streptococcus suis]MCL4901465.1 gp58-like family protein [Streptococcus suis]